MRTLLFAVSALLLVPALRAQQAPSNDAQAPAAAAQTTPSAAAATANEQNAQPAPAPRQGHPLDPADVDILTGKRDRDREAARRAANPVMVGGYGYGEYGYYGDRFLLGGRRGAEWDIPELPLPVIGNPFFFSRIGPGGFGRGIPRGRR